LENLRAVLQPTRLIRLLTALPALAGIALPAPAAAQASPDAITSLHCTVTPPKPLSRRASGLTIAYENTGPTIVHAVTFTVGYTVGPRNEYRTVDDAGIFAPNTRIKHHFVAFSDVPYTGPATTSCKVTAIR
jgi:hypothetical protein